MDAQIIKIHPELRPLGEAYGKLETALYEAWLQVRGELHAIERGQEPDASAPSGFVYAQMLALEQAKNIRAHVEEYAQ